MALNELNTADPAEAAFENWLELIQNYPPPRNLNARDQLKLVFLSGYHAALDAATNEFNAANNATHKHDAKSESVKAIKSFLDDAWGESPLNENGILEVIELIASGKIPHLKFE